MHYNKYSVAIQPVSVGYSQNLKDLMPTNAENSNNKVEDMTAKQELVERQEGTERANPSRIYGENWIVMQNKLVYSISNLGLDERRMILFLSPLVRKAVDKNPDQKVFTLRVKDYAEEYNITNKGVYARLKEQSRNLQSKNFLIWLFDSNEKEELENSISWSKKTVYKPKKGEIDIELDEVVIEMLTIFDKNHPFTKYSRKLLVNLNSYALILLELVASFEGKRNKREQFTTEYLREKFGCVDRYEKTAEFVRNVLKTASKTLQENTHYLVDFKTLAKEGGRKITHIEISLQYKPDSNKQHSISDESQTKQDGNPPTVRSKPLTEKQMRKVAANKELFVEANSHLVPKTSNDTYSTIFSNWEQMLMSKEVSKFKYIQLFLEAKKGDDLKGRLVALGVQISNTIG